ncbi:unnamed protein product [Rotaria sp. Silwood1]|nr:unnamed protein product [Rotaria sp. Silwood1]CAF1692804.1 unnamed protein product [Rotaria sp. Silwood1]CAF3986332.1 unnamed protein product [Rotaria sp. Silwood1]CAF5100110.1 unnamed protein product [Rotaria sp. Silwood1]
MATNSENSPGHESVVIDNDEGISVESNRTTIHIKKKGVKGSFIPSIDLNTLVLSSDKTEWPKIFAREASIIDQVRP